MQEYIMCYGYYREKDAAGKESTAGQADITRQTEMARPETPAAARQAEEKAVARFLARVRQMVAGHDPKREEVA
jgi:hypothetical protein